MKVGIITKIGKNYGAILQAYALKKTFQDFDCETQIIKYVPQISKKTYKVCKYPWRLRGIVYNLKSLFQCFKIMKGSKKILEFREKNFNFTSECNSIDDLANLNLDFNLLISGSDQIWNPCISFDPAFYLEFVNSDKINSKLISYAASIGLKDIPKEYINSFKERLQKYDFITVREKRAKDILNNLDIESVIAPDPTLLIQPKEWLAISKKPYLKEPYILCYFVSYKKEMKHLVDMLQKKLKYKVVNLMTSEESSNVGNIKIRDAGPEDFIGWFSNASFVLTSSFHGTIFSILNRKPFATILYKQTSSRVEELLKNLKLKERIISTDATNIDRYIDKEENIYNEKVLQSIENQREYGISIIKEIIDLSNEK